MRKAEINKIATLVPVFHLEEIRNDKYFMALSHMVDDKRYADFYLEMSDKPGNYIILDNSVIEMGEPERFETYIDKALKIGASQIMLPDIFQKAFTTTNLAKEAIRTIKDYGSKFDIMVIPQGVDFVTWREHALEMIIMMLGEPYFYDSRITIGISARYTDIFCGSRMPAIATLCKLLDYVGDTRIKIHLLGCYADPRIEAYEALKLDRVQGIDSSFPCVYTRHGYPITRDILPIGRPARKIDFLQDAYDIQLLRKNISVWKEVCQKGLLYDM